MTNSDYNLDKEIEEGLARAESMLRKQRQFKLFGVLGLVVLCCSASLLIVFGYQFVKTNGNTGKIPVLATVSEKVNFAATQTIGAKNSQATSTARVLPTLTLVAKSVNLLRDLQISIDRSGESIDIGNSKLVFGPISDSLIQEDKGNIIFYPANVRLENFIVGAIFINPYDAAYTWDYGFMFRDTGLNQQYRLIILSDKTWQLGLSSNSTWTSIYSSRSKNLTSNNNEKNQIFLVAINGKAFLFINGNYIKRLDISRKLGAGEISIATGLYKGNAIENKATQFQDFVIWSLP